MQYKFFTLSCEGDAVQENKLNLFLRQHRVISVDRKAFRMSMGFFWSFCVEYFDEPAPETASSRDSAPWNGDTQKRKGQVDYREKLSPEDFAIFLQMRAWRKSIAEEEKIPVYRICTNEVLAKIVQNRCVSCAELLKIKGLGEGTAKQYGDRLLAALRVCVSREAVSDVEEEAPTGETRGK